MSTFSCQCQSCRGSLVATEKEFYFASPAFRVDLDWGNVKRICLETQQVKGVPTSVLVVVLQRHESVRLLSSSPSAHKKRGSSARKYFFYGFQDLLGAEEQLKHHLEQFRAAERMRREEAREDLEKGSSATTRQKADKAAEKDDVSSSPSETLKEESLNNSRIVTAAAAAAAAASSAAPRKSESDARRAALGLSFAGRRAPPSNSSRPKLAGRLVPLAPLTPPAAKATTATRVALRLYRYLAVLLVVAMLVLLALPHTRVRDEPPQHPFATAEKLLRDIHALSDVNRRLESYDSQESLWRYNTGRKDQAEGGHVLTRQLEKAAVELMQRYVALQAKLTTLRGHRAERVAREEQSGTPAPPPPPSMSSEFGAPKKTTDGVRLVSQRAQGNETRGAGDCSGGGAACTTASRRTARTGRTMTLSRLAADVQRWARLAQSVWRFAGRLRSATPGDSAAHNSAAAAAAAAADESHRGQRHGDGWVVYTEEMSEHFRLAEWVPAAEDEDRRSCRRVAEELLETVELTERVFAAFSTVLLADRYRLLESGEERMSHWMQPPQALRTVTGGRRSKAAAAFSGAEVARVAMLRRFVSSLLHSEPLEANQARRRGTALQVADAMLARRRGEVQLLRARNRGERENVTELWRVLDEDVVRPAATPLRANPDVDAAAERLRNSVAELRFWHAHEAAWREHVLSFFTPEEQAEVRARLGTDDDDVSTGLTDPSAEPTELHWVNVPLFRGLLCFEPVPYLQGGAGAATAAPSEAGDDADEQGDAGDDSALEDVADEPEEGEADDSDSAVTNGSSAEAAAPAVAATDDGTAALPPTNTSPVLPTSSPRTSASAAAETTPSSRTATASTPHAPATPPAQSTHRSTDVDLWKAVKLRWMADLDVFRLAFDTTLARRSAKAVRSLRMDEEDHSVVADAAEVRRRLFRLLSVVDDNYVRYLTPTALQRFGARLRALLPPYFRSHSGREVYVTALRNWGTQDPAVQLAAAQVTGFAPGTTSDVSRSLLYLILQPPPLLQTSVVSARQTTAAVVVLVLFVGVLTALYMMH
ncbi:hypothetical protein NESM_000007700 [Novymonas esmeraldas]|uniref:Transmembrane protein n=1 Tax=Novymonas esmeraldas TaxID=1808958 RepID=A0AAW0F202_9TRYP